MIVELLKFCPFWMNRIAKILKVFLPSESSYFEIEIYVNRAAKREGSLWEVRENVGCPWQPEDEPP